MNHAIINSQNNTYQIKINNNLLEIHSKKDDSDYYLQIMDEKLLKRINCSLEKTNGFTIKINDNNTEKNKLKIIIESEYSENSYIELPKKHEEKISVISEIKKIKKQISLKLCYMETPYPSDFIDTFDDNDEHLKKMENYLLKNTNYKSVIEELKKNMVTKRFGKYYKRTGKYGINCSQFGNFRIYDKNIPITLKNIEMFICHEILNKYGGCIYLRIGQLHFRKNMIQCDHKSEHISQLKICRSCKFYIDNPNCCRQRDNHCDEREVICDICDLDLNPNIKLLSDCRSLLSHDINNLIGLRYYEILYNVLSQDGFHPINFTNSDYVECVCDEKSEYEYKFVIANKVARKYYNIITNKEISAKNKNIFYTHYMYKLENIYCFGKLPEISRRLFLFRKKML